MGEKIKIYICCHKDYENVGITNPIYKLITSNDIKNNSNLELIKTDNYLDNRMWSELSQIYYIWKHPELQADNIGICHYRRYFDFMNDIPDDLSKPLIPESIMSFLNNFATYSACHNGKDLLGLVRLIKTDFKDYLIPFIQMMDSHIYYPYNMFILNKELFNQYCEFIFNILLKLDEKLGINNNYIEMIKHIGMLRESYIKRSLEPNNTFEYQARLYGFLAERLTTAFFIKYKKENGKDSLIEQKIKITEKTYNKI